MMAAIIANGDLPDSEHLTSILDRTQLCICADGGANGAHRLGIIPDYVIGDLDSIDDEALQYYRYHSPSTRIIHQSDQSTTDLEKCLVFLQQYPVETCYLLGVTGDRSDHFLYALHLLHLFSRRMNLIMISRHQQIFLVRDQVEFDSVSDTVSFFGFPEAGGVTTEGFHYAIKDCRIGMNTIQSISNRIERVPARLTIRSGCLLVIVSRNEDNR
ncbi:MAG: thiamine diphosphokinase [Candidatus Delongbacteria bacterium]|nr:thiamine diphosphokinase [Candidatus Delongbacteria bacterium]